jgi:hypothetical protein
MQWWLIIFNSFKFLSRVVLVTAAGTTKEVQEVEEEVAKEAEKGVASLRW